MISEGSQPNFDQEFWRIAEQADFDQRAVDLEAAQQHHEAAAQQPYDEAFQRIANSTELGAKVADGAQSLRDRGHAAATEVLDPNLHDDERLDEFVERERTIREWTAEAVRDGDDPQEAEKRYRAMFADADARLAASVADRYEQGARAVENFGARVAAEFAPQSRMHEAESMPRQGRMRELIQRGRGFVGKIFGLSS